MKFGEKAVVKITEVDKKGRGCGKVSERRACVPFAGPGEEVEATLLSRKQGNLIMKAEAILKPSPHRITPRCPYVGRCGGCAWQQFDYGYQLELKRDLVNRVFEREGVPVRIEAVTPAPEQFYYRNRMDYCIGPKGELGLKEPGRWNAYLDLETCFLLSPDAVKAMAAFRAYMRTHDVKPWDSRAYSGYARYFVIREGKNTGKRMITIVTSEGELPAKDKLLAALSPFATTIYHGINPTITDLSTVSRLELLHGEPLLTESVAGKTFAIHPNAFFQTNTGMAAVMVDRVKAFLAPRKPSTLLDLYCGVGFFGICLAADARRVIGVEMDENAIAMAKKNAESNGVANAEFSAAKAEALVWEQEKPDTVIVDPPRAGLHPKVAKSLLAHLPERIVYVSCNYESFARDWKTLEASYALARVEALDLFPHSPHVELITLLERKIV